MATSWQADAAALFESRLGKPAREQGLTCDDDKTCPDIWRLSNGDVAVIGQDLTEVYAASLPEGVALGAGERLVVLPGVMLSTAKRDIPDV